MEKIVGLISRCLQQANHSWIPSLYSWQVDFIIFSEQVRRYTVLLIFTHMAGFFCDTCIKFATLWRSNVFYHWNTERPSDRDEKDHDHVPGRLEDQALSSTGAAPFLPCAGSKDI